ncbi:hypothetical protein GCM10009105_03610 [Dokdonella soli]|uniref:Uncharacterized protein n=1 Tax=Dokdonella soli TaxID=529810 RepID=A0ABN1ICT8_9GAMM
MGMVLFTISSPKRRKQARPAMVGVKNFVADCPVPARSCVIQLRGPEAYTPLAGTGPHAVGGSVSYLAWLPRPTPARVDMVI